MTGPVVAGTPVVVGGTVVVGTAVVQPRSGAGAAQRLDDLLDVAGTDEAPVGVPLVLRRGQDEVFRTEPLDLTPAPPPPRSYQHTQPVAAPRWQIVHNLGFLPTFTAYDTSGAPVAHDGITHPVPGQVSEVLFGMTLAGSGYAS